MENGNDWTPISTVPLTNRRIQLQLVLPDGTIDRDIGKGIYESYFKTYILEELDDADEYTHWKYIEKEKNE